MKRKQLVESHLRNYLTLLAKYTRISGKLLSVKTSQIWGQLFQKTTELLSHQRREVPKPQPAGKLLRRKHTELAAKLTQ